MSTFIRIVLGLIALVVAACLVLAGLNLFWGYDTWRICGWLLVPLFVLIGIGVWKPNKCFSVCSILLALLEIPINMPRLWQGSATRTNILVVLYCAIATVMAISLVPELLRRKKQRVQSEPGGTA